MITAIVSAITGIPVRRDVAMTGEISLRGNVLAIGGLREKTMAAYSAGVNTVLIPADNTRDFDELDSAVRESIRFIPCKTADDVLSAALVQKRAESVKKTASEEREDIPQMIHTHTVKSDSVTIRG